MKFGILLASLIFSFSTFASDLSCSLSTGLLKLSSNSYMGGAGPFPGMQLSRTEWNYNGITVYLKRTYNSCDWNNEECQDHEEDPTSNIEWTEVEGTRNVLAREGGDGHYFERTTYAVQIKLKSSTPGQVMTGMSSENFTGWFICEHFWAAYP